MLLQPLTSHNDIGWRKYVDSHAIVVLWKEISNSARLVRLNKQDTQLVFFQIPVIFLIVSIILLDYDGIVKQSGRG
jgi:hypothetical protein